MLYNLYKVMMIFDRPYSKDSGYVNGLEMQDYLLANLQTQ